MSDAATSIVLFLSSGLGPALVGLAAWRVCVWRGVGAADRATVPAEAPPASVPSPRTSPDWTPERARAARATSTTGARAAG